MKITYKKVLVVVLMAGAVVAGIFLFQRKEITVKAIELKPGDLRVTVNATTTSTIKSEYEATLAAQRTGRVIQLAVKEGDRVRAGALIARLDLTEESVQSESVREQSRAAFQDAERNLKRVEDLFAKGLVAQQDLDSARKAHDVAKTQYEAAKSDVNVRKDYSVIRAPFDGVVAKKFTEGGELLLPGKQIVSLVDPERIYVLATIDEVDVGRLKLDQPVTVTIDAFPGERFEGIVRRVSPIVTGGKLETRTADVWIYFKDKQERVKPGMSADVEILVTVLPGVLSVPTQAIIERGGVKQVYVAEGKGLKPGATARARLVPVEIGENNWNFTQITKGLAAGDTVVTTPDAEGLKPGVMVRISGEK